MATAQLTLFAAEEPLDENDGQSATSCESPDATVGQQRIRLRALLAEFLASPVASLVLTRNRRRMLSAKPDARGLAIRLHRCFLDAPPPVTRAVAILLDPKVRGTARKQALAVAREHFSRHAAEFMTPSRLTLKPLGRVYDLVLLRDRVEREYFGGDLHVDITWSRPGHGRADRRQGGIHIRLGSYDSTHRLVRIHPVLDREQVPEFVVESVVHHEMLHAAEPPILGQLRRTVHTRAFRQREREFYRHEEAERWIERNLRRLARWRRQRG
ncbi:MAG: hypothetical protein MPN21_09020 [Thermoanaerobaculia bacterium]|nr:hypothetical protein [Thermoanaerobaculia bacterium]